MSRLVHTIPLLVPLALGSCVIEPPVTTSMASAAPERPSHRLTATSSAPQSLEQGRLDPQRLQVERDRIDAIGRQALGAADRQADWQPVLQRLQLHPGDHQLLEYGEQFRQLPILAPPIRLEIRGGRVIRIEGEPHRLPDDFDTTPAIDQPSAEELARIYVSALPNAKASSRLVILPPSDIEGEPAHLAWQVDLPGIRVWIDAGDGRMLRHRGR